jgi:hypothetical protein
MQIKRKKIYPLLLILGAGVLLFRTIRLLTVENGWELLALWVIAFTFVEMIIDLLCIIFSFHWLLTDGVNSKKLSLRFGAAAALFHAFRVLIYVLGRIGPWENFDLKTQFQQNQTGDKFWLYFASVLSLLGIIGVVVIWWKIRKNRTK